MKFSVSLALRSRIVAINGSCGIGFHNSFLAVYFKRRDNMNA